MLFHTPIGLEPPVHPSSIKVSPAQPFAWLQMPAASVAITVLTRKALIASTHATGLDAWPTSRLVPSRRLELPAFVGQLNVVCSGNDLAGA